MCVCVCVLTARWLNALFSASPLSTCIPGPGSYPCPLLMCHSHRQEPLELFCESCDLLCCSSCHLSSHKNHRSVLGTQGHCRESVRAQVKRSNCLVTFIVCICTHCPCLVLIKYSHLFVVCDATAQLRPRRSPA